MFFCTDVALTTFVPWVKFEVFCKNHRYLNESSLPLLPSLPLGHDGFGLSSQRHSQSKLFKILPLLTLLSLLAFYKCDCPLQARQVGSTWRRPVGQSAWLRKGMWTSPKKKLWKMSKKKDKWFFFTLFHSEKDASNPVVIQHQKLGFLISFKKLLICLHPHSNLYHQGPLLMGLGPGLGWHPASPRDSCILLLLQPPHP